MKRFARTYGAVSLLAVAAFAATPPIDGIFAIQQGSLADPVGATTRTANAVSGFGAGDIQAIGDFDLDGIEDYVAGAKTSHSDWGSFVLVFPKADGSVKTSVVYSSKDPAFSGKIGTIAENFGEGIAVLSKVSNAQECAKLAVTSTNRGKIYGITLCREAGASPILTISSMVDTSQAVLSGLYKKFQVLRIGATMAVVDTISTSTSKEIVLALGVPEATRMVGSTPIYYAGSVVMVAVNPATWAWRRLSILPNTLESGDLLKSQVYEYSSFGYGVAAVRTKNGKYLAVLSPGDTVGSSPVGRIHLLKLDADYQVESRVSIRGTTRLQQTDLPYSLASGDFDHDGNTDLVVGYPYAPGPSDEPAMGGYSVYLLDGTLGLTASKFFANSVNGVQPDVKLTANSGMGAKLLAADFDRDGQIDVVAGSQGLAGSLSSPRVDAASWMIRMKSLPWLHKAADTIRLSNRQMVTTMIPDYLTGNKLSCSYTPAPTPIGESPIAECSFLDGVLTCQDKNRNGKTSARVICQDEGNMPSSVRFADTLDFILKVTGANELPRKKALIPVVVLREDQPDTATIHLVNYFEDPEGTKLTFAWQRVGASSSRLVDTAYISNDSLHVRAIPYRFGKCSLLVKVTDGAGAYVTDTISIEIKHVNHAPIAVEDRDSTLEATSVRIAVTSNDRDPDGDATTISAASRSAHGSITVVGKDLMYMPDSFFTGKDSIRYVLSDGALSGSAMLRINVRKRPDGTPPRIVRALPSEFAVPETNGKESVRIGFDSLFFSQSLGFAVPVVMVSSGCDPFTEVIVDPQARDLVVTPKAYKSGECRISLRQHETPDSIASSMVFQVASVPTPYRFAKDTLFINATKGDVLVKALDSLDLDQDSIEYSLIGDVPAWVALSRSSLVLSPDKKSSEAAFVVAVQKKPGAKQPIPGTTDSLVVVVELSTSSIQGRMLGGVRINFNRGTRQILVQAGDQAVQIDVLLPNGIKLAELNGQPGEIASALLAGSGIRYLRVREGTRRTIHPILLQ